MIYYARYNGQTQSCDRVDSCFIGYQAWLSSGLLTLTVLSQTEARSGGMPVLNQWGSHGGTH